jgi:energy-converting hydrogenase B subunit Q
MMTDLPDLLANRYSWMKQHSALEITENFAVEVLAEDRIGLAADITKIISATGGNVIFIQSWIEHNGYSRTMIQVECGPSEELIKSKILAIPSVKKTAIRPTYISTYGKRIIILGGGAQVAQVASGAIAEADRHNIRGETISVDTVSVVGEQEISRAVMAVGRLHRAGILVLAGVLMGGKISKAVTELRHEYGVPVISLKMAGSVNSVSDLIVTDPTAAGVMAVMLISHVGKFNLLEIHGQEY